MDYTVNMMDGSRIAQVPANMSAALAAYPSHTNGHHPGAHTLNLSQNQQHSVAVTVVNSNHQVQLHQPIDGTASNAMKEDCEDSTFTPPPRVASVGSHPDTRVEKTSEAMNFEAPIKMEIRGQIPGVAMPEKDKNNVYQLQFESVAEVLKYFQHENQRDAISLMANADFTKNFNPEMLRNHFLCNMPNASQEANRSMVNNFSVNHMQPNLGQTVSQPLLVNSATVVGGKVIKQERRQGDVPPGTIIHRNIPMPPQPNQFMCWICDIDLLKSLPFEEHMTETHNIAKPYKCDQCEVPFKRKAHLDRHRKIHLPSRPYECGACGKGFTRNEHVRRHAFTHSGERPFKCDTCAKTFFRHEHLKKHIAGHMRGVSGESSAASAHAHTPGFSLAGIAPGLLLQTTDHNGRLLTLTHPPTGGASLSALSTAPSGSVGQSHSYHMPAPSTSQAQRQQNNAANAPSRPFQCGVCGKTFIRNEHLRRHVSTHSGKKPFPCQLCTKAFSRKEHLTKHMKTHKSVTTTHNTHTSASLHIPSGHPSLVSSQASSAAHAAGLSHSLLNNVNVSVGNQSLAAHHSSSVSAHIPPGPHFIPMFNLLAEVV